MASEVLVQAVKQIMSLARSGKAEEAYDAYRALFADPAFTSNPPDDQRRVLNLMVHAKKQGNMPPDHVIEAHRAAIGPLTELAAAYGEPADFEMLGLCQVMIGDEAAASTSFKAGLHIERERNPQSNLCGALMKWVASV
jgi:hypothetical protein